jgi:hypothetical protein
VKWRINQLKKLPYIEQNALKRHAVMNGLAVLEVERQTIAQNVEVR